MTSTEKKFLQADMAFFEKQDPPVRMDGKAKALYLCL